MAVTVEVEGNVVAVVGAVVGAVVSGAVLAVVEAEFDVVAVAAVVALVEVVATAVVATVVVVRVVVVVVPFVGGPTTVPRTCATVVSGEDSSVDTGRCATVVTVFAVDVPTLAAAAMEEDVVGTRSVEVDSTSSEPSLVSVATSLPPLSRVSTNPVHAAASNASTAATATNPRRLRRARATAAPYPSMASAICPTRQ
jgi:hypothetical protein